LREGKEAMFLVKGKKKEREKKKKGGKKTRMGTTPHRRPETPRHGESGEKEKKEVKGVRGIIPFFTKCGKSKEAVKSEGKRKAKKEGKIRGQRNLIMIERGGKKERKKRETRRRQGSVEAVLAASLRRVGPFKPRNLKRKKIKKKGRARGGKKRVNGR